jgi:rod shape-determining protein MreD
MATMATRLGNAVRTSLPVGSVILLMLLALAPWPWPWFRSLLFPLPLMAVCYWIIYRPDLFSMRWSFITGLIHDLLLGVVPGLMAFSFLAADFVLRRRHSAGSDRPFMSNWLLFAVIVLAVTCLQWAMARLLFKLPVDLVTLLLTALPGILLFPILARVLHAGQRLIAGGASSDG